MTKRIFTIPNISCGHCVNTIKNELSELDGVKSVTGDPKKKQITVDWESPASIEKLIRALQEINYPASQ